MLSCLENRPLFKYRYSICLQGQIRFNIDFPFNPSSGKYLLWLWTTSHFIWQYSFILWKPLKLKYCVLYRSFSQIIFFHVSLTTETFLFLIVSVFLRRYDLIWAPLIHKPAAEMLMYVCYKRETDLIQLYLIKEEEKHRLWILKWLHNSRILYLDGLCLSQKVLWCNIQSYHKL